MKDASGSYMKYESTSTCAIGGAANILLGNEVYLVFDVIGIGVGDRNITDEQEHVYNDTDRAAGIVQAGIIAQF